jgi:hypothetical protein
LGSVLAATAIGYVWRRRESVLLLVRVLLAAWCGALLGYLAYGWAWLPFGAWIKLPSWATCGTTSLAGALLLVTLAATMRQRTDRRYLLGCVEEWDLERVNNGGEYVADGRPQDDQNSDHDDGDQDQDQRVLDQALAFFPRQKQHVFLPPRDGN